MDKFSEKEFMCQKKFESLGSCWHMWTGEGFDMIFCEAEDYEMVMNIIAICSRLMPQVKIITFEVMSNHLHFALIGQELAIRVFFESVKTALARYFRSKNRKNILKNFECQYRAIESLAEMRNVIAYINRNGYVVSPDETPFSYQWGANICFFNPYYKLLFKHSDDFLGARERRSIIHSHQADGMAPLTKVNGYASPMGYCAIIDGEELFRSASQYFYYMTKNVEADKNIAKAIGERIFYTDDELYSAISAISFKKYSQPMKLLPKDAKIELATLMHNEYNAANKQISRMLGLDYSVVCALFPLSPGR